MMISHGCMRVRLKAYPTREVSSAEAGELGIGEIAHEVEPLLEPLHLQTKVANRTNEDEDDWCFVRARR